MFLLVVCFLVIYSSLVICAQEIKTSHATSYEKSNQDEFLSSAGKLMGKLPIFKTAVDTASFTTQYYGSYVGYYEVYNGPSWQSSPSTYTCQQACAYIFGGVASDYFGSTTSSYASRTCYLSEYGYGGCQNKADTYSVCSTYTTTGCMSAYVQDNCQAYNYCFQSSSKNPTKAPTPAPTKQDFFAGIYYYTSSDCTGEEGSDVLVNNNCTAIDVVDSYGESNQVYAYTTCYGGETETSQWTLSLYESPDCTGGAIMTSSGSGTWCYYGYFYLSSLYHYFYYNINCAKWPVYIPPPVVETKAYVGFALVSAAIVLPTTVAVLVFLLPALWAKRLHC